MICYYHVHLLLIIGSIVNLLTASVYSPNECNNGLIRRAKLTATSELPDRVAKNAILNEYTGGKTIEEFFRLMHRNFSEDEWQQINTSERPIPMFFRLWALKESYVKAIGTGIGQDLRAISFRLNSSLPRTGIVRDSQLLLSERLQSRWHFDEQLLDQDHCTAIAYETAERIQTPQLFRAVTIDELLGEPVADRVPDETRAKFSKLFFDKSDKCKNAWSAANNDFGQYLTVDLGRPMNVTRIETQGRSLSSEFVKEFTVSYATNGYVNYKDITGTIKTFQANSDGNSVVLNEFEVPIIAQFIRINPVRWNGRISLRLELYGCDYESDLMHFNGSAFVKRNLMYDPVRSLSDFIRFRFKTAQPNGILVYSQGLQGDLLALNLRDNQMFLHVDLGLDHLTTLKVGSLLDNDLWHDVVVSRNRDFVEFSVDRVKVERKLDGSFRRLDLDRAFYVGGVPDRRTVIGHVDNFTGCIENLFVNSTNFIAEAKDYFQNYRFASKYQKTDGGILFSCPEPREIPVTFTSTKSYVRLVGYEDIATMNVTLSFRTFEDRGLLLYHKFRSGEFVKLFLDRGKVKIKLAPNKHDLQYTPVFDNFNRKFNDGKWHSLVFTMAKNSLTIAIDREQMQTVLQMKFSTGLVYYVAGHPDLKDTGFVGCMKSIGIDGNYRQPPDWTKDQYCCANTVIFSTCLMNDKCDPNPCQNNGTCNQNSYEFKCDCTNSGYTGAVCRTPLHPLSCVAYKSINSIADSQHEITTMIDIDGSGHLKPFPVTCSFLSDGRVLTYVHHANETYVHVPDSNRSRDAGSYRHEIAYDAGYEQIEALVNRSNSCRQNMIFKCKSLALFNSPYKTTDAADFSPYSWWTNGRNQKMDYWGGGLPGSKKCYCGVHNSCVDKSKFCNCDSMLDTWHEDAGDVLTKEHLPIREMRIGGVVTIGEYKREAMYKIGPLVCEGDNLYDNTITFRLSDSVLMLPTYELELSADIYFEFRTTIDDAVLFHSRGPNDFIKLSLIGGHKLMFEYQTASGTVSVSLTVSSRLNDNRWHSLFVERNRKEAKILLDGALSEKSKESDGLIRPLKLGEVLVFGADADQKNGFVGCVRALQINGRTIDMVSFGKIFQMYGLSVGCVGKCDSGPCLNNGTCFEHYQSYHCDCRWSSFKGPICADDIGITMRSNSYVKYDFIGSWRSTIAENIRVGFTTTNPKGFLLGLFSNISGEYLTVMVSNSGHLRVVFDFGFERQEIIYPDRFFGVGQYHDVRITRKDSGSVMLLKVDHYPPKAYKFNIKYSADAQFNNVQYLYVGKNETMSEGFIGCISRVEFDDIYPLKLLFQQNPPANVHYAGGILREDYCGVEPVTHPPDRIETKPVPELDQEKLLRAYNHTNTALWGSLFAVLIVGLVAVAVLGTRYIAYYKGEYLTQEDVGADIALDSDTAVVNSITGHQVQKKQEWFI